MKRWIVAFAVSVSLLACNFASACPMCKDSIPNGESNAAQAGSLPGGFNTSVYFLLSGLFATIGLMTLGLVKGIRSTNVRVTGQNLTSRQNSRGFEVRSSDSSQDETE
jgi:hypothetical protein